MAGAKPGVHLCQLKLPQVNTDLIMGSRFIKIDEETTTMSCYNVLLKVDPKGYIAYWKDITGQHETDFIDLYLLRDIRSGKLARVPKDAKIIDACMTFGDTQVSIEDKTITMCWGNDFVNLQWASFVASTAEIARLWCQELFSYAYNQLSVNVSVGLFYERAWTKLKYTQHDGQVAVKNVLKLFALHKDDKDRVVKCLRESGINVSENGDFIAVEKLLLPQFIDFCCSISFKQDAQQLFDQLKNNVDPEKKSEVSLDALSKRPDNVSFLSTEQVTKFLNSHQRDPRLNELLYPFWNEERVRTLVERFEPDKKLRAQGCLSVNGFLQLLISEDNNVAPFDELDLSHEMTHPLNHYYVASSHNTYLTGHQLTGKSSVEMYRQVLLSGCRCVELDCWDGRAPEEEPIIKHGFTMVTEIPLKEALDAIQECAFRTSDFPIILSLENHCCPKQQMKIALHLRNVFGSALLTEPLPSHPLEPGVPLPSPSMLLRRVLIKNKKTLVQQPQQSALALPNDKIGYRIRTDSTSSMNKSAKADMPVASATPPATRQAQTSGEETTITNQSTVQLDSDAEGDSGDEYVL